MNRLEPTNLQESDCVRVRACLESLPSRSIFTKAAVSWFVVSFNDLSGPPLRFIETNYIELNRLATFEACTSAATPYEDRDEQLSDVEA